MLASTASTSARAAGASAGLHARAFLRPRPVAFHEAEAEVYAQGDKAGAIYRVEYGAVRICRLLADGRRQVVAFHLAGETFGFEAGSSRSFYAEAMVPTGLSTVDVGPEGRYSQDLVELALNNMIRAQEHLLVVGRQSAIEKIAVFLLDLEERQGQDGTIDLPMTRTDIGDYLGMTIETVSRTLSKMRSMGILRLKNARCVELVKAEKLRQLCE